MQRLVLVPPDTRWDLLAWERGMRGATVGWSGVRWTGNVTSVTFSLKQLQHTKHHQEPLIKEGHTTNGTPRNFPLLLQHLRSRGLLPLDDPRPCNALFPHTSLAHVPRESSLSDRRGMANPRRLTDVLIFGHRPSTTVLFLLQLCRALTPPHHVRPLTRPGANYGLLLITVI